MYLDNAATTMVDPEVLDAMRPYLEERYGNPETAYRLGRESKDAVEKARAQVSELLGCLADEVYFTSGGTEANNWAVKGHGPGNPSKGILTSAVEHSSVLEPARRACKDSPYCEVPVDEFGRVDLAEMEGELVSRQYHLVSVQYANNEVGTLQPVREISGLCRKYGAAFHCDAVQAYGKVPVDVDEDGFDMASMSAHKIHGPMGVGALYARKGTDLEPFLHGGGQESGMRSGTLAVHDIVGFGKAAEMALVSLKKDMPRVSECVEALAADMAYRLKARRNGHPTDRLPNVLSVTLPGFDASLSCGILCTRYGICVSSGSACGTRGRRSHVLEAMGRQAHEVASTLRVSLSRFSRKEDMGMLVSRLQAVAAEAKKRSLV